MFSGTLNVDTGISGNSGQNLSDGTGLGSRAAANIAKRRIANSDSQQQHRQFHAAIGRHVGKHCRSAKRQFFPGAIQTSLPIENLFRQQHDFRRALTLQFPAAGFYLLQSDSGHAEFLAARISAGSTATGTRTLTFPRQRQFVTSLARFKTAVRRRLTSSKPISGHN